MSNRGLVARSNGPLWAVSVYFNPSGYRRRLWNYRVFREQLAAPLLTVELGFDGRFDLTGDDADLLIQLPGRDILWQKERLLNLAVQALPPEVTKAVWLDCDVIFERADWPHLAEQALDEFPLVQAYTEMIRLPREDHPVPPATFERFEAGRPAICSLVSPSADLRTVCREFPRLPGRALPGPIGFGWAFRRELIERHSFYDVGILGGGDMSLVAALAGCYDLAIEHHHLNSLASEHYLHWARPLHAEVGQQVGCLPGRIAHLWHGEMQHRGYDSRYAGLRQFAFDPARDIAHDERGVWRWASHKPEMHAYVAEYFASRREDG